MALFDAVGQLPNGSLLVRHKDTGQQVPVNAEQVQRMRAAGTLNIPGAAPAPTGRAQSLGNQALLAGQSPQQAPHPNARATQAVPNAAMAGQQAQPTATPQPSRPNLSTVTMPQRQQQQSSGIVRKYIAPREAGYVPHSKSTRGLTEEQNNTLLNESVKLKETELKAAQGDLAMKNAAANREAEYARLDGIRAKEEADKAAGVAAMKFAKVDGERQRLDDEWAALDGSKVDRDRYYKNQGWAGTIFSTLAIALSEYGSKYLGSENTALRMINKLIDDDIQSQLDERDSKKESLTRREGLYAGLKDDSDIAYEELRMMKEKAAAAELRERAAEGAFGAVTAQAEQTIAQIEAQALERKAKILAMTEHQENQSYDRGSAGGYVDVVDPQLVLEARVAELKKKILGDGSVDPHTVRTFDGTPIGKAANAPEINEQSVAMATAEDSFDQLESKVMKGSLIGSDADFTAEANSLMLSLAQANKFKLGSENDTALIASTFSGTERSRISRTKQVQILREARARMRRGFKNILKQNGLNSEWVDQRPTSLEAE